MRHLLARACAVLAPSLPLLAQEPLELRFAPAEGSVLRRTVTLDHTLVLQELRTVSKGQSQTIQESISLEAHQTLRTLDTFRKIGEGRPLLLQRRFDELSWKGEFVVGGAPEAIKAVSPLGGTSVLYTWVPEDRAYGKYYDARESTEETLLNLAEDLDLRALLPDHALHAGESWSVPAANLVDVLAPCGRLDWRFDAQRTRRNLLRTLRCGLAGNYVEYFGGESKGECKATLAGVESGTDGRLARIDLELKLENQVDQRGLLQAQMTGPEIASGYRCLHAPVTWRFEGKGKLVWDLDARHAASLELEGSQSVALEVELSIADQPPQTQHMSFAGGLRLRWTLADPAKAAASAAPPVPK